MRYQDYDAISSSRIVCSCTTPRYLIMVMYKKIILIMIKHVYVRLQYGVLKYQFKPQAVSDLKIFVKFSNDNTVLNV